MHIEVKSVNKDFVPVRAHKTDVGYDLHSIENTVIPSMGWKGIKTGISIALPNCVEAVVRGRSGKAKNDGIFAHVGTIDPGYQGEIEVILMNFSQKPFDIKIGDRIGQMIFHAVLTPDFKLVREFSNNTVRGTNGFGSTGA